jgi:hypothetical protein
VTSQRFSWSFYFLFFNISICIPQQQHENEQRRGGVNPYLEKGDSQGKGEMGRKGLWATKEKRAFGYLPEQHQQARQPNLPS